MVFFLLVDCMFNRLVASECGPVESLLGCDGEVFQTDPEDSHPPLARLGEEGQLFEALDVGWQQLVSCWTKETKRIRKERLKLDVELCRVNCVK